MGLPIPTIPIEIISKILSHLRKNDLLKCRLVSQPWNGLSLKILRNPKYGHYHELTKDNIKKFLEFSKERNEEWVLPFHIKCIEYGKSELYPQIPEYIQQLQTIFGEECVGGLTLRHKSSSLESVEVLMSILTLIAPSVTHLDLSKFRLRFLRFAEEIMKVKEMLGNTQLNFPNLSKLKSCPALNHWSKQDNVIHSFTIAKSQNLKELEVISPYDLLDLRQQICNLRKLKIVNEFARKGLDLDAILEPIRTSSSHTLPVLKDLSLTYMYNPGTHHQILIEFLSPFSTSLQSLTVKFYEVPTNPFPTLSQLKFLRIQISKPTRTRSRVDPERLNLNSETFPVLESMNISTNFYFESTHANSGNSKDESILGTVKNLSIRVMDSPFSACEMDQIADQDEDEHAEIIIISKASAKNYVDHLQELFPNVTSLTSLTLVNESDGHEENLNHLLIAFIESDGAPKIQELAIQNYEKNYLGHILNGLDLDHQPRVIIENMSLDEEFLKAIEKAFQVFSGGSRLSVDKQLEFRDGEESRVMTCKAPIPIHFKMTGLEKMRMGFLKIRSHKSGQSTSGQKSKQKDLFLMSLPKHLPLLRQIDISHRMFGEDKEFCKQQIVHVRNKFPDLTINTTR